jgi:D-serine dehydratase
MEWSEVAVELADRELVDHRTKGIPGGTPPFPLDEIGLRGWNLLRQELPLPVAVLRESALDHNSRWMRRFLASSGVEIAPHGKTSLSPALFQRQLDDGAWGITVATVHQFQVCRDHGIQRVVLANQLVGKQEIRYVLDELHRDPELDFYCLVDSVHGVRMLADAAREHPLERPVQLLLEGGYAGGRAGCRTLDEALEVARAVRDAGPALALRGVEGFEGLISADSPAEMEASVSGFLDFLVEIASACAAERLYAEGEVILSAGGSAFFDMVPARFAGTRLDGRVRMVVRSGCYLTHDSRMYRDAFAQMRTRSPHVDALGEGLRPALEVWAHVQSRPEPELAILTLGKRDCGFDGGNPVPLAWFRPGEHAAPLPVEGECEVLNMNDQHAFVRVAPGSPLAVGDMVSCGISHPCTTFDKWKLLFVVSDGYDVVSAVRTYF